MPLRLVKSGQTIETAGDWRRSERSTGASRSAHYLLGHNELTEAFFGKGYPEVPWEIVEAGTSHPDLEGLSLEWGIPSHRVAIGPFGAEHDQTDVVLVGSCRDRRVAVSVDAVADESFGDGLADFVRRWTLPPERPRTDAVAAMPPEGRRPAPAPERPDRRPEELAELIRALVPDAPPSIKAVLRLRLLLAVASALVFARRQHAHVALLAILEFDRDDWPGRGTREHRYELNDLAVALTGPGAALSPGDCLGPIRVPGNELIPGDIPVYLAMGHRNAGRHFH
ncbi:MAG TPA: hypothetical protein VF720_06505 [Candidatus Eisenbacteria bacterium]